MSVVDKCQDHAVQINKEAEQVEAELNHGLLHVGLQLPPVVDLRGVEDPHVTQWDLHIPVDVPRRYGQVEDEDEPVHGHHHQHCRQALANQLRDYPSVEFGAAGPGINVVTL